MDSGAMLMRMRAGLRRYTDSRGRGGLDFWGLGGWVGGWVGRWRTRGCHREVSGAHPGEHRALLPEQESNRKKGRGIRTLSVSQLGRGVTQQLRRGAKKTKQRFVKSATSPRLAPGVFFDGAVALHVIRLQAGKI